jgi:hypothetical protein
MRKIKAFLVILLIVAGIGMQGLTDAREAGFSTATDPGFVTFKDIRLTLPEDWGTVAFFGRDRLRYEAWDYFASATDNDYEFAANQLRLGAKWTHQIFNINYTHQYTQLSNLPAATSAGAGAGSLYFSNSRDRFSHSQFVKYLNLEIKQTRKLLEPVFGDLKWLRGVTEMVGRFNYSSGNEMKSSDKKIEWLKTQRIGDRLIGGFEWAHYGRSFDGFKVAREDDFSQVQIAAFNPTQGGFEERANRTIYDIDVLAAEANIKKDKWIPGMEENFFYYNYDDHRNIAATTTRFDNTGRVILAGNQSNLELHTFGGHVVGNYKVGSGLWDVLGWGAYQTGNWFELDQSAYAWAAETGYQLTQTPWQPWLRAGFNTGSGDGDASDGDHETFFQMLPTARIYSFSLVNNMMNSEDAFVSLIMKPKDFLTLRTEFHNLRLSDRQDRWYIGSGAMHDNIADDFAARSSSNKKDLGQLLDVTAIWNVNPDMTVMAYYGHMFEDNVTEKFFTNQKDINFFFLEVAVNF